MSDAVGGTERRRRPYFLPLAALLPALLSMLTSGFEFGVSNNVFHIPYVLRLAALPEFDGDALYRSLSNFTSAVWPLLRAFSTEANVEQVFLLAHLASRALAFAAILLLVRHFGIRQTVPMLACLGLIAVSPWLQGLSAVGGHGLFLSYFTHSEVTWPSLLLAMLMLRRRRLVACAALTGLTFAVNAFVGIWLLAIVACMVLQDRRLRRLSLLLRSAGAFILVAAPVIVWIGSSIHDQGAPFSYSEYIRAYYPYHFLIESTGKTSLLRQLLLLAAGILAAAHLPRNRFWISIQLAWSALLAVGALLPYLFDQRFIFNLHLLRSAGVEQMLASILIAVAAVRNLCQGHPGRQSLGLVLAACLLGGGSRHTVDLICACLALGLSLHSLRFAASLPNWSARQAPLLLLLAWAGVKIAAGAAAWAILAQSLPLAAYLLYRHASASTQLRRRLIYLLPVLCIAVSAGFSARERLMRHDAAAAELQAWQAFTTRVRQSELHGLFLLPPRLHDDTFQLLARRPVWVDYKQGAAVMWSPSFHEQWMTRYADVSDLEKAADFQAYARRHDIPYFVVREGGCPSEAATAVATDEFSVCATDPNMPSISGRKQKAAAQAG